MSATSRANPGANASLRVADRLKTASSRCGPMVRPGKIRTAARSPEAGSKDAPRGGLLQPAEQLEHMSQRDAIRAAGRERRVRIVERVQ